MKIAPWMRLKMESENQELFFGKPLNKAIFSDAKWKLWVWAPGRKIILWGLQYYYWNSKCGAINVQWQILSAIINQNVGLSALTYAPDLVIRNMEILVEKRICQKLIPKSWKTKNGLAAYNTSFQLDFCNRASLQVSSVASQAILTNSFTWAIRT